MLRKLKSHIGAKLRRWSFRRRTGALRRGRRREAALVLLCTPEHTNLGDHALAVAAKELLGKASGREIIEITGDHCRQDFSGVAGVVRPDDILFIAGGGFLGSLWPEEENTVCDILATFPRNRVIILPQTVFWNGNAAGEARSRELWQNHGDLHVFLRERASYDYVKNRFCGKRFQDCRLMPDLALYLTPPLLAGERRGVGICLRRDKESANSGEFSHKLVKEAGNGNSKFLDTIASCSFPLQERESRVTAVLREFQNMELVITDRLHGMLFSVITGTPCIAMDNVSGKVGGVWTEWLKDSSIPVRFSDSPEQALHDLRTFREWAFPTERKADPFSLIRELRELISSPGKE